MDNRVSKGLQPSPERNHIKRKRYGIPEGSRKRAVKACETCRRVKERCQGGPPCARCKRLKKECKFAERVQTPELRSNARRTRTSRPDVEENSSHSSSDGDSFSMNQVSSNTTHYSDQLSHSNFSHHLQRKVDGNSSYTATKAAPSRQTQVTALATQLHKPSKLVEGTATFPPPQIADFLFDTFFEFAQTNYSYVDEHFLREKLLFYYSTPKELNVNDAPWIATVLMVFAVGTQFAHLNSRSLSYNSNEYNTTDDAVALTFYQSAKELIPDMIALASVECVQAFVLLGVYALPVDAGGLSWVYFGIAMRIAIQNGMHRNQQELFDTRTNELRRMIWWTAYTLERRISVLHGKPVSIKREDVDIAYPSESAELRASNRMDTMPNVLAMIRLTETLEEARDKIVALKRTTKKQRYTEIASILKLKQDLETYWYGLTDTLHCRDLALSNPLLRFNIHLALTYHLIHIFIGRSFILKGTQFNKSSPISVNTPSSGDWSRNYDKLVDGCVQSALAVIDLCQLLQDESGLARSSYTEYTSCCAALLVVLARRFTSDNSELCIACDKGVRLVKHMAVGLYSDSSEKLVVEALEAAISRLNRVNRGPTKDDSSDQESVSGYESFRNWAKSRQQGPQDQPGSTGFVQNQISMNGMEASMNNQIENVPDPGYDSFLDSSAFDISDFAAIPGLDQWFQYGLQ